MEPFSALSKTEALVVNRRISRPDAGLVRTPTQDTVLLSKVWAKTRGSKRHAVGDDTSVLCHWWVLDNRAARSGANWQSHLAAIDSVGFPISVVVVVDGELDVEPDGELPGSSSRGVDHVLRHADNS